MAHPTPGAGRLHLRTALATGYGGIATAAAYGNEKGMGPAVREGGLPRDQAVDVSSVTAA